MAQNTGLVQLYELVKVSTSGSIGSPACPPAEPYSLSCCCIPCSDIVHCQRGRGSHQFYACLMLGLMLPSHTGSNATLAPPNKAASTERDSTVRTEPASTPAHAQLC